MVHIVQRLTTQDSIRSLTPTEVQLGCQILKTNLAWQPGDSIFITASPEMLEKEAAIWFEAAKTLTHDVQLFVVEGMTHSGEEPPDEVVQQCTQADISLLHTFYSLTHTQAGKAIVKSGRRGASLPGVSYELMFRTLNADYSPIKSLGEKIKNRLENAQTMHITTQNGTDLSAKIRRPAIYNDGGIFTAGELGNLPAGEVFFAPLLGSMNGTLVVDGSIADDQLDTPIKITVENGLATNFSGGLAASNLEKKLRAYGEDGLRAAEIGIGTNRDTSPTGDLIEAEKAYGTVHIAFGNSSAIGGEINVPIHLDGVVLYPRVEIDGKVILEKGEFYV